MARTQGHGNPDWTRDETILALALYFESGKTIPSRHDPRVIELSELLRSLPYHLSASKKASFRNPDGVGFKLQNLHNVATGKGLGNVSQMDRRIWAEFGSRPDEIKRLAELLRAGITAVEATQELIDADNEPEFYEGRLLTQLHRRRERNPNLRKRLLASRRRSGKLACDLCRCPSSTRDPVFEDAAFEVHHTIAISLGVERITRLSDVALLCANCHRLVHRVISIKRCWLSIDECRRILDLPRTEC
jgi:5-methylcytosine-specific restriction protein A